MSDAALWSGDAPAKVNLRLHVVAREESGYHQIETVFQALDMADRIELALRQEAAVELRVKGVPPDALGPPEQNLVVRAAHAFGDALEAIGSTSPGVHITLEKVVPHGAGLGGGSSDAAAVLRGMNQLLGVPLPGSELMRIGAQLGSDVPFFGSEAALALGRGRGDQISPLDPLPERDVLLVVPAERIGTAWAYSVLAAHRDAWGDSQMPPMREAPGPPGGWQEVAAQARNDFEAALFPLRLDLAQIKETLQATGARPALLSGSGSAVFGIFKTREAALAAEAEVTSQVEDVRAILTRTRT